jgi:hypothetical protein
MGPAPPRSTDNRPAQLTIAPGFPMAVPLAVVADLVGHRHLAPRGAAIPAALPVVVRRMPRRRRDEQTVREPHL